ncbi:hypothetical protein P9043_21535 [Bacillus cereus]|nr:hypothetical protein [Bacillus cereus]
MADIWTSVVVPLGVALVPSVLTFLGARNQTKNALKTAQVQHAAELQKMKEQQQADLQKLKEQQQAEMNKMKEQQNAEMQKIKEQSLQDIEKMKVEIDKQAELYERNAQTDVAKEVMGKMFSGESDMTQMLGTLQALQGFVDSANANNSGKAQKQGRSYPTGNRR